jgi:hypothetical protein
LRFQGKPVRFLPFLPKRANLTIINKQKPIILFINFNFESEENHFEL